MKRILPAALAAFAFFLVISLPVSAEPALSAHLVTPASDTSVDRTMSFVFESQAACSGGSCGEVLGYLDPIALANPFPGHLSGVSLRMLALVMGIFIFLSLVSLRVDVGIYSRMGMVLVYWLVLSAALVSVDVTGMMGGVLVSTTPGDTPFYTIDPNPQSCGNLSGTDICTTTWKVYATGDVGTASVFYVIYNSSTLSVLTDNVTVTITAPLAPLAPSADGEYESREPVTREPGPVYIIPDWAFWLLMLAALVGMMGVSAMIDNHRHPHHRRYAKSMHRT